MAEKQCSGSGALGESESSSSLHSIPANQDRNATLSTPVEKPGQSDEIPDGGYGWVCTACVFFINAHTWGINSSYGVFLSYYLNHDY